MEEKISELNQEEMEQVAGGFTEELNQAYERGLQHWAREYRKQGRTKEELLENTDTKYWGEAWRKTVDRIWEEATNHD